jgi:hypothetical protein
MFSLLKPSIAPAQRSRCHVCSAMSYRRAIVRDTEGRLKTATDIYQCTGCSLMFRDLNVWKGLQSSPYTPPHSPVPSGGDTPTSN